jgi:UDP-N-acetylglucosamine transferase subunit ALG13
MIFMTLGTHDQPFHRAIELLAPLDREDEIIIQHGSTPPRPDLVTAEWVDYLESGDLLDNIRRADIVISHAGVGSMLTAIRNSRKPIVLPRLGRFGEHVDDHQLQLANRFAQRGLVFVCGPSDSMEDLVYRARYAASLITPSQSAGLREAVARLALVGAEPGSSAGYRVRPQPFSVSRRSRSRAGLGG